MKICHVITMKHMAEMGVITQYIHDDCIGEHIWCNLYDKPPKADIYILHCFKNQLHFPNFILWKKPKGSKVISLIHSSEPCMPAKCSDIIVTITKAWQSRLKNLYNIDSEMIYGGIDLELFKDVKIDYSKKVFGKITRPEIGKYHKNWDSIVENILNKNEDAECRIISNGYNKLNYLNHPRMKWIEGIGIGDYNKKIKELSKLSVYTECHNDGGIAFIDTFCISMLEAMACGLPIVLYKGLQEPMAEVLGNAGIICDDINKYLVRLDDILNCENDKIVLGNMAKQRAQRFGKEKMIESWNKLLGGI